MECMAKIGEAAILMVGIQTSDLAVFGVKICQWIVLETICFGRKITYKLYFRVDMYIAQLEWVDIRLD